MTSFDVQLYFEPATDNSLCSRRVVYHDLYIFCIWMSSCVLLLMNGFCVKRVLVFYWIFVDLVQQCIEGLKKGKAARVVRLMAEHICFAHPIVSVHLTLLFAMLYKHSMVPDDFGRGVVIPLLKNVDGNKFTTDNYRGITLVLSLVSYMYLKQYCYRSLKTSWHPIHCNLDLNQNLVAAMPSLHSRLL